MAKSWRSFCLEGLEGLLSHGSPCSCCLWGLYVDLSSLGLARSPWEHLEDHTCHLFWVVVVYLAHGPCLCRHILEITVLLAVEVDEPEGSYELVVAVDSSGLCPEHHGRDLDSPFQDFYLFPFRSLPDPFRRRRVCTSWGPQKAAEVMWGSQGPLAAQVDMNRHLWVEVVEDSLSHDPCNHDPLSPDGPGNHVLCPAGHGNPFPSPLGVTGGVERRPSDPVRDHLIERAWIHLGQQMMEYNFRAVVSEAAKSEAGSCLADRGVPRWKVRMVQG